jgi:hypothetical protein
MRPERHSSALATVVKANGRNQEWPKCPVRRLPYAELDNLYTYVPLRIDAARGLFFFSIT